MNALHLLAVVAVGVLAAAAVVPASPVPADEAALPTEVELNAVIEYVQQLKMQLISMQAQALLRLLQDDPEKRIQTLVELQEAPSRPANELEDNRAVLECDDRECEEHCRARPGFNAGFCNHYRLCSCYYRPEEVLIAQAVNQ